jgi:hypothetical protein
MTVIDFLLVDQFPQKRHVRSTLCCQGAITQVGFVEL